MSLPLVDLPEELEGRNVLVVPHGTDVVALATAWFPDATWTREPVSVDEAAKSRPMTGARFRGIASTVTEPTPGLLRLNGAASLEGPTQAGRSTAQSTGLVVPEVDLYALVPADPRASLDLVYGWMAAAARRAAGSIVPADRAHAVVVPDPGAAVDLTLWSAMPLSAQDALPLVRPAMTGARVGPTDVPRPQQSEGTSGPPTFSVTATFEYDGAITVRTGRSTEVPVALSRLDWREFGPWSYHVTWIPPQPEELRMEHPSQLHLIARSRVVPSVARIAAALWRAVGGTVVDSGGFIVTPGELQDRATAPR